MDLFGLVQFALVEGQMEKTAQAEVEGVYWTLSLSEEPCIHTTKIM